MSIAVWIISDQCLGCNILTVGEEFLVEDHNNCSGRILRLGLG